MISQKCCFFLVTFLFAVVDSWAQWPTDPTVNVPICTFQFDQAPNAIVSDDSGGAIIVWSDGRYLSHGSIYAQRVGIEGKVRWRENGVEICSAPFYQHNIMAVRDGKGGAIIFWLDYRSENRGDLYGQRIDSKGNVKWTVNGVFIPTTEGRIYYPAIVSDGSGGAIIAWEDDRNRGWTGYDIYAQRVDSTGHVRWGQNGVPICTAIGDQFFDQVSTKGFMATDEMGGAIIVWRDGRKGANTLSVYAQRVDHNGNILWFEDGAENGIGIAPELYGRPFVASDHAGGAIIAWPVRTWVGTQRKLQIRLQHVSASGHWRWDPSQKRVTTSAEEKELSFISDGDGGVFVGCYAADDSLPVYWPTVQHLDSNGERLFGDTGVRVGKLFKVVTWTTYYYVLGGVGDFILDGQGGVITAWSESRNLESGIYAQRVDKDGNVLWPLDGVPICTAPGRQSRPLLVTDESGGAIITWADYRNSSDYPDIYAQRVYWNGLLPVEKERPTKLPNKYHLYQNYPNPFNKTTLITYQLPGENFVSLTIFDLLGCEVTTLLKGKQAAGQHTVTFDAQELPSGVYFYRLEADSFVETKKMVILR